MKAENEELKTTFELPDHPTKRQIGRYEWALFLGAGKTSGDDMYERLWVALPAVAQNWQSAYVPALGDAVLDSPYDGGFDDSQAMGVIRWAGMVAFSWYQQLKEGALPKN